MNHMKTQTIKAAPTIPPTTPPAILPAFELPLDGRFDTDGEGDTDANEANETEGVLDGAVDWLFLVEELEVGRTGTLPVTSGKSVTGPSMRKSL